MRYRIDWKRLGLLVAVCILAVALVRGCLFACARQEGGEEGPAVGQVLRVYNAKTKKVMRLDLEEYVVGVVAAEMPVSFEPEALKAQAVAARTYAARALSDPCAAGRDVCTDSTCCQSWRSPEEMKKNWGTSYEANYAKVTAAVYATAGEIVTYGGKPIQALYHSTSGGQTEDSEHVFSSSLAYLRSVESPGEESAARFSAVQAFSLSDFVKKLNKEFSKAKLTVKKAASQVKVLSRFDSGRVELVQVGGAEVTGREFRRALSLNSANFRLKFSDDEVEIETSGFGHGVGMSQYGANAMAKEGADYRRILHHYYTDVDIVSMGKSAA